MKRVLILPSCLALILLGLLTVSGVCGNTGKQLVFASVSSSDGRPRETARGPNAAAERASEWRPPPGHTLAEIEAIEGDTFDAVNKERSYRGLDELEFDPDLLEVARSYSRRMAEEGFFSHKDPEGDSVIQRVAHAGLKWRLLGENLAYERGYVSPAAITLTGWMDSPGHRKNILEPRFDRSAIGAWISNDGTVYFTEILMRARD